nr:hypothetical protein [Tanacetum cinerariifolium]
MQKWPIPSTLKQLKGFLGLTGYYRRFIKDYTSISQHLVALPKKDAFKWNPLAELAYHKLKKAMVKALVLALPNFEHEFVVETNASGKGIGALPKLLGYDYEIEYKKGSENVVVDALSRMDSSGEILQIYVSSVLSGVWNKGNKYSWTGGILKRKGKVVIGNDLELRKKLVQHFHDEAIGGHSSAHVTMKKVEEMDRTLQAKKEAIKVLKFHLKRSQDRMRNQANKHRTNRQFEVGDWIYLKLQPHRKVSIRQGQQHKLSPKYYGHFKVAKRIREVAYRLDVGVLPQLREDGLLENNPMATLERRLGKVNNKPIMFVLIQWTNKPVEEATWEIYGDLITRPLVQAELAIVQAGPAIVKQNINISLISPTLMSNVKFCMLAEIDGLNDADVNHQSTEDVLPWPGNANMAFDLRPTKDVHSWPGNANMAFDLRPTKDVLPLPGNANMAFDLRPTEDGLPWPGNANMIFDLRPTEDVLPWSGSANMAFILVLGLQCLLHMFYIERYIRGMHEDNFNGTVIPLYALKFNGAMFY